MLVLLFIKGQMNKVYFDDNQKKLVIEKVSCPVDSFQPVEGDCYTACTQYKHEDKEFFESWGIKVLYSGNSSHAGVGYCDIEHGYVSSDSKMYTSLQHGEVIICDKLDDIRSRCGIDKRLLPGRLVNNIKYIHSNNI